MARVVKGSHSFTYTPTRLSTNGMNHSLLAFAFLPEFGIHLPTRDGCKTELAYAPQG